MKSWVVTQFHMPFLAIFALLLFFLLFAGVVFWVFRKSGRELYHQMEQLPLETENKSHRQTKVSKQKRKK